jgi:hypothetical protein
MSACTDRGGATVRLGSGDTAHRCWLTVLGKDARSRARRSPPREALDWNENADDLIFESADNQTGARCGRFSGAYHTASLVDAESEPCKIPGEC